MIVYLVRRVGQSLLAVMAMAVLVFLGVFFIGNPVDVLVSPEASQAQIAATVERLGLDRPLYEQFGIFVWNALHGDLGTSFVYGRPALEIILDRLPATLELALVALALSVGIGIPLGVWAGLRPHGIAGRTIMGGSILGFSLPNFWQGMLLILVFAVLLGWLPAGGRGETTEFLGMQVSFLTWDGLSHLILPAINLALFKMSLIIRLARANTREVCMQDYVKFARAKGLSPRRVVLVHVLKNIMIPVVTIIGLELGSMVAFAIVTETVFAWPGMGKLLIDSINLLDRPVIVAYLMLTVLIIVGINLLVDVIYSALDPRIRLSEMKG
ncbi:MULTISPECIES: ABC transporter permease [Paracoccus]|jgi:peptide/nickel transport system permease protein|uniref:ABC transporter permease n=2 Tax=Paracoccus TaxID=265 RepID=A0A5C4R971_9RHOB|nr:MULTISPECIES: ABC transporter permease [Paracoccus]TYP65855.1 peptide/nickel transport system permease protein [Stutzerimonas stutzeri]AZY95655.1 ABC transporter permease [Paracoccus sp. Arc7-R13]KIX16453.1 ABC transporter permease [Paracoccus sp. 228]KJZ31987.1 ABC transporter permease [Paracoccus sp. S4493]TNH40475.1 ABC transporter permease [Paracoccus haeundaensis]|tara:strand:+ start:2933 stop:3910 length:978 start_codon:yes stop_codon:yes gene_type:complete